MQYTNLMERLKIETSSNHVKTESNPLLAKVTSSDLTLETYALIIVGFRAFTVAIEAQFPQWQSLVPGLDLQPRSKLSLLDNDVLYLESNLHKTLPSFVANRFPSGNTQELVLGTLYVLEGSTLGGRIILRSLEKNLGLSAESGACFYEGYGERTGVMWKSFGTYVNSLELSQTASDRVVESARTCFNDLDDLFAELYATAKA